MIINNIQILNILVDNSNPNFSGAIIKVWWRLNCMCTDGYDNISYQCSTNLTPQFDENFIAYQNITNQMLIDWIIQNEGETYTNMTNMIEKTVINQATISQYSSENYIFLDR